jgi:hypothetical protein
MKYVLQFDGSVTAYDENSEVYTKLLELPEDRRPKFLNENSKPVRDYFSKVDAEKVDAEEKALFAEARESLLDELVAGDLQARVQQLRNKKAGR